MKKFKKFFTNPDLFFYDMFRKRLSNKAVSSLTKQGIKLVNNHSYSGDSAIDTNALSQLGFKGYVLDRLHAGVGARDGRDQNSLILWGEHLYLLFCLIIHHCKTTHAQVDIFTTHGENFSIRSDSLPDAAHLLALFCKRANFVIELFHPTNATEVLSIHLFDIDDTGVASVRTNKAWIKKFPSAEITSLYNGQRSAGKKIDAVYTWVNQSDPQWQEMWKQNFPETYYDKDRYTDNSELKYSLRSLSKYAPWINRIFIVSNCKKPSWLVLNDRIHWIDHQEIFPAPEALPTFNSHAIECCLHRIPDLEENFIYFNDDFFLAQPCLQSDFFDEFDRSISYFEPYGMVSGASNSEDPDYLVAAKNSRQLLQLQLPSYEARQLHKHVPYALKKSVLQKIERHYPSAFTATQNSKTRSSKDINLTSFLYHHYAVAQGSAVCGDISSYIVRPTNILKVINHEPYKYKILCFNDGNGSATDSAYKEQSTKYFKLRYHQVASWEASNFIAETINESTPKNPSSAALN
ncbi:stealth conserved region 3 domain-containing protein [Pseudomonas sp. JQ170]|uniref:stealth conserved region 3 domain-containing protein n=1 Tax=unclassified Pseudomonas TaxID=196821 RepID=UPI002654EDBF|nr:MULTISPECIES: stealth conserved region 3 domain-containing protein [unclassified Pseudomonas]MDN7142941.1 stealth conserved region 3 domain-containing protein [Pseudomonas sp. JQ170]WRO74561.1 stealth conserved region 3 domain-containing protein [Pseudomonas sp. 170C]